MFIRALAFDFGSRPLLHRIVHLQRVVQSTLGQMDGELQIRANRRNAIVILSRCWRERRGCCNVCVLNGVTQTETLECHEMT